MPKTFLRLEVPKEVRGKKFEREYVDAAQQVLKEQALLRLFEQGKVSAGYTAETLGMTRHEFYEWLAKSRVSPFNYSKEELIQEFVAAGKFAKQLKVRKSKKR
ncbi:MAG TPA: UPF0175 family protein [Acidobacteriota bacterium]|jgi:predicted HTH domain antitoxin